VRFYWAFCESSEEASKTKGGSSLPFGATFLLNSLFTTIANRIISIFKTIHQKIIWKEEGTYKITGTKITIVPRKAIFSSHKSTKEYPPLRSGNLGLAVVQYSFEFIDLHNDGRCRCCSHRLMESKQKGMASSGSYSMVKKERPIPIPSQEVC
jgi:hypothetical protein